MLGDTTPPNQLPSPGPQNPGVSLLGWITSHFVPGIRYKELERFSPEEARARRFESTLARTRKELEDRERLSALSQANKNHLQRLKEFEAEFSARIDARRRQMRSVPDRPLSRLEGLRLYAARSEYLNLSGQLSVLRRRARQEARSTLLQQASAADRRNWYPGSKYFRNPRDVWGGEAKRIASKVSGKSHFINSVYAVPCVRRLVRREVMFAKDKAGRGYRVKHRLNQLSNMWC